MSRARLFPTKNLRYVLAGFFLLFLAVQAFMPVLVKRAEAVASINWVNASTITYSDTVSGRNTGTRTITHTFTDSNPKDANRTFISTDKTAQGNCSGLKLVVAGPVNGPNNSAEFTNVSYTAPGRGVQSSGCKTAVSTVTLGSTANAVAAAGAGAAAPSARDTYRWGGKDTITFTDSGGRVTTFTKKGLNFFSNPDNTNCSDFIDVNNTNTASGTFTDNAGVNGRNCGPGAVKAITIANTTVAPTAAELNTDSQTGEVQEATSDENANCENKAGPFSWVLCPIFDGIGNAADFLFSKLIQPLLITDPVSTNPEDTRYRIWSGFRIYGNIFLLVALIIVVFGQAIGGGLVDAYTAKKVLPRLLAAAILINLSIYIVAFLVDITNVLGNGIYGLITEPVTQCEPGTDACWNFSVGAGEGIGIAAVGIIGLFTVGVGVVAGAITAIAAGGGAVAAFGGMLFFIALPMILAVIGVFITLIVRQGIILALIIVSPVAFALYVLPNTEEYFKKWWDALFKTLLVYPIVMAIFAVSSVLSIITLQSGGITPASIQQENTFTTGVDTTLSAIIGFALQFLPLFLIPFAFRIAGGLTARIASAAIGAGAKINQMGPIKSRRQQYADKVNDRGVEGQERFNAKMGGWANNKYNDDGTIKKGFKARAGRGIGAIGARASAQRGGTEISEARAAINKKNVQRNDDLTNFGDDYLSRGLTVDKDWALNNDRTGGTHWKIGDNGQRQFKSAGGAWIDESKVDQAHKQANGSVARMQSAWAYELKKATEMDQMGYFNETFSQRTAGKKGGLIGAMSEGQATGILIGAGFAHQGAARQIKGSGIGKKNDDGTYGALKLNGAKTMKELNTTVDPYSAARFNPHVYSDMSNEADKYAGILESYSRDPNSVKQSEYEDATKFRDEALKFAAQQRKAAMAPAGNPTAEGAEGAAGIASISGVTGREVGTSASAETQLQMQKFIEKSEQLFGPPPAPPAPPAPRPPSRQP